jgi:DNA-binding CsgD family transcriptional regulator
VQRAAALVEEARDLALTTGQERSARHASVTLAMVEAVRGREDATRAAAADAVEGPIGGVALQASRAAWALGRLELGLGRPAEALAHLEAVQHGGKGVSHPLVRLTSAPDLVEAAARAGRQETSHAAMEAFDGWARASDSDWMRSALERMRGLLAGGDDAEAHFEASLEAIGDRFPFDGARTRLVLGEWLRRARRRSDAREHLRAAHAVFEALGAQPWADRARLELRATGEAGPRSASSTLDGLTPQELGIARLVADGATNKEIAAQLFLSVRTIEYHLHKVFTKLGIASRHALARLVHEDDARREPALTP